MKQFKIRSSQVGQIMTMPRAKKDIEAGKISKTSESYCINWLKEQLYNRRKEVTSKYMEKGNIMEDESIDFISEYLDLGIIVKNEKYFENDFLTGTPDIILNDCVIDVKNSWSWETFPLFETDIPNKDYYYQLQSYMILTGKTKAKLIYALTNTPLHLIEKEAYFYAKNNGYEYDDIIDDFIKKMTYSDIDDELKIKVYDIEKDDSFEEKLNSQVEKCRKFINEQKTKIK